MTRADKFIAACLLTVAAVCVAVLASMPVLPGEPGCGAVTLPPHAQYAAGRWTVQGRTVGYSTEEDSPVYACPGK